MTRLRLPRFRLSRLMEAVAALAVLLAFWNWSLRSSWRSPGLGCLTFIVTGISAVVIATILSGATDILHPRLNRWERIFGIINILIALWFVSIEWYWFFDDCPNCHRSQTVVEYKFVSLVLYRRKGPEYPTLIECVAADLGTPCSHEKASRWLKQRWSGLCLLVEHGGCGWLYDPPWYPPCARNVVRSWLAKDPAFAHTFRKRVLEQWDRPYWRSLLSQMCDGCPVDQLPSYLLPRDEDPAN